VSGHKADEADEAGQATSTDITAGESRSVGAGLLNISQLSLEDLSQLDDSVVANVLRNLVERHRCGTGPGERYNAHNTTL
jgi:hypothetical protein